MRARQHARTALARRCRADPGLLLLLLKLLEAATPRRSGSRHEKQHATRVGLGLTRAGMQPGCCCCRRPAPLIRGVRLRMSL